MHKNLLVLIKKGSEHHFFHLNYSLDGKLFWGTTEVEFVHVVSATVV